MQSSVKQITTTATNFIHIYDADNIYFFFAKRKQSEDTVNLFNRLISEMVMVFIWNVFVHIDETEMCKNRVKIEKCWLIW